MKTKKIWKPTHEEPGKMWLDYILLPYGEFYKKTKVFLDAKKGDTLRLYNGPEVVIDSVMVIEGTRMCDFLSRMRYGLTWDKAFQKWLMYARMEGHGKDIINKDKCILISYDTQDTL